MSLLAPAAGVEEARSRPLRPLALLGLLVLLVLFALFALFFRFFLFILSGRLGPQGAMAGLMVEADLWAYSCFDSDQPAFRLLHVQV